MATTGAGHHPPCRRASRSDGPPVSLIAATFVPLLVSLLFAAAIDAVWRRRPESRHARTWSIAFALIGCGWAATALTVGLSGGVPTTGATPSLCWLAAALMFVHGLRQRAGRVNRGAVLAAIWTAVAFGTSLLLDLAALHRVTVAATVPVLAAIGLLLAAVAVGPRGTRWMKLDGAAMGLLAALAVGNLGFALILLELPGVIGAFSVQVPLWGVPVYVALGLAAMLLLNDDLSAALHRLARTDPLTGVWNRRGFEEAASFLIERLRNSTGRTASVAIADIDSFKAINDLHGHTAGDAALIRFAQLVGTAAHKGDLFARLGGEEFALLAIGVDGPALVERVERARALVGLPSEEPGGPAVITASFGVAQLSPRTLSLRDALERADAALYRAKSEGKNRTVLADLS